MTFTLNDDEQNGVSIAVNTILKNAFNIGDNEDWSQIANQWWNASRPELDGNTAQSMLPDDPGKVVELALATLRDQAQRQVGIFVMPTEEGLPPRAAFIVDIAPGVSAALGGVAWVDGAWRFPDGTEVEQDLAQSITEHAESLGVEWDH